MELIQMSMKQLNSLLHTAAQMGAAEVMRQMNTSGDEISKREAERRYGRKWVEAHLAAGDIKARRKTGAANSKMYLSNTELYNLRMVEREFKTILKVKEK